MNNEYKNENNSAVSYKFEYANFGGTKDNFNRHVRLGYIVYVAGIRVGRESAILHESDNWAGNKERWTYEVTALDSAIKPTQQLLDTMLDENHATMPMLAFEPTEAWDYSSKHEMEPVM